VSYGYHQVAHCGTQIVSGVPVQISLQVTKELSSLTDPDTSPNSASILSQVSLACEVYGWVVQLSRIQSCVPAQILLHVTNELAALMVPEARLNFWSRLSQVSPGTERYSDLQAVIGVEVPVVTVMEQSSAGMQIGVFSQMSLQLRKEFEARISPPAKSYNVSIEPQVSPFFE